MTLQAIIVDDEPLARQRIRDLLDERSDIEVSAECRNGTTAIEAIRRHHPDLVFLDVQMPDVDGFGVIEEVGADQMPPVIFVTAFDKYAVDAFETGAVDYLLKPFDRERFQRAVDRMLERQDHHHIAELDRSIQKLLELTQNGKRRPGGAPANRRPGGEPTQRRPGGEPTQRRPGGAPTKHYGERLIVRSAGSVHFVRVDAIDWIEAARNYVKIHCEAEVYTMRETMARMEKRMDPERFLRIHRSTLVNIDRIRKIEPGIGTESIVVLEGGARLMVSRAYRRGKVKELLS